MELKLGQSVNLLQGYNPTVFLDRNSKTPLKPSQQPALFERVPTVNANPKAKWDEYPVISLHNGAEQLLSALQQIKLRRSSSEDDPSQGGGVPAWPAGALMLQGGKKALDDLSAEIGLDLSLPGMSYALVQRGRKVATAVHSCCESGLFLHVDPPGTVRPETVRALSELEKKCNSYEIGTDGASGYLQFFKTFGSHFISQMDYGDTLFQVFSYEEEAFTTIYNICTKNPDILCGVGTHFFQQYTVQHNKAGYGYVEAFGKICLTSDDSALATSIEAKQWYDGKYALHDSIFAPYCRSCDSVDVDTIFHKQVVIGIELASLSEFAEYYRKLIWRQIFKGAMYSCFANGKDVAPYFSNNCPYDLSSIYKDSDILEGDGLMSLIATPSVSIFKERIELDSVVLRAADTVKYFSTFSNSLEISLPKSKSALNIPGSSVVSLVSHVISVEGNSQSPPTLCVSDSAYSNIKSHIYCGEFYGGLRLMVNADGHGSKSLLIMNGLVFEGTCGEVTITADFRVSPSKEFLGQHLTDFQFSLVAAESRLNFLLSNSVKPADLALMRGYLEWLGGSTGDVRETGMSSLDLQARALYLAKLAASPSKGVGLQVPYLKYDTYRDTVSSVQEVLRTANTNLANFQAQIRNRKAEERTIDRDNQLNENIIKSGKLLCAYISSQAEYQEDLSAQFALVLRDKEKEMGLLTEHEADLSDKLRQQQVVVRDAVEAYKDAVADWQTNHVITAAIGIASNLFALGFLFVTPAGSFSALKELGITVQSIQKAVKIFDAVIKAYRSFTTLPKNPQKVIDALADIGPEGLEIPTSLEWSEMKVNMDATLEDNGPNITAKNALSKDFAILVLRGKALIDVQNVMQTRLSELSTAYSNKRLHDEQRQRFSDINTKFDADPKDLDVAKIDLVGLSGQLLFFQRQMLMIMAATLVIQDRALQYEYLQPPMLVESFSFTKLQLGILSQAQRITHGLDVVHPMPKLQPEPIVYEVHNVTPKSLTDGNSFAFTITLDKCEFRSYNYVRVEKVEAEIGGIVSTNSGKYYTELKFDGNPFMDRGFQGEPLTFQTTPRLYTYLYNVSSSCRCRYGTCEAPAESRPIKMTASLPSVFSVKTTDSPNPFDNKESNVTPFSTWRISLPPTASNEGIKFDDCLTLHLIFYIYAQLKEDNILTTPERIKKAFILRTRNIEVPPEMIAPPTPDKL